MRTPVAPGKPNREVRLLLIILGVGLLQGAIYLLLVPAWQHYDEPTHFEYAWSLTQDLLADPANRLVTPVRREIAASMIEQDFFRTHRASTNLLNPPSGIWTGIPQVQDPPLYYFFVSMPLSLVKHTDIVGQLYVGRVVSLILFLATLVVSYGFVRELTTTNHPLRLLVPLSISLTPAFVDLMTSINNDVGAILIFSFFLWTGIRILRKGFSLARLLALIVTTTGCYFTKNTVWVAVPLAIVLVLIHLISASPKPHLAWPGLITLTILGGVILFSRADAGQWYRANHPAVPHRPTRVSISDSHWGKHALRVRSTSTQDRSQILFQPYASSITDELEGNTVTLGGWIWSNTRVEIDSPILWYDGQFSNHKFTSSPTPSFWSMQVELPASINQLQVVIDPKLNNRQRSVEIYYDGLVLLEGEWPATSLPQFDDATAASGLWGERRFQNLIRNPSFESSWITILPSLDNILRTNSPINLNQFISGLQDRVTFGPIYRRAAINLFQSFWARFGWNHVRLHYVWYWFIAGLTLWGMIGAMTVMFQSRFGLNRDLSLRLCLIWLSLAVVFIWVSAILRINFPVWNNETFIPSARYAYPAIIPTLVFVAIGWFVWPDNRIRSPLVKVTPIFVLLLLNIVSLFTISNFF